MILRGLYETTYLHDVIERNHLRNPEGMKELMRVIASGIGSSTNPTRIANTFQSSQGVTIKRDTIFEQIVGLQEEYKEKATGIAEDMINSGNVIGGEKLQELIDSKPSIHKKLIKVERNGGYKDLTPQKLNSMKRICKKYGDVLPNKDGKLFIDNEQDVDIILKALGDYYKIGEISKKAY